MRRTTGFCFVLILCGLILGPSSARASFELEGAIRDNDGVPVPGNVQVTLRVMRSTAGTCLLYMESHATVTADTLGWFLVNAGMGTPATGFTGIDFDKLFSNSNPQNCRSQTDGSVNSTFIPTETERREIFVTVYTPSLGARDVGTMTITSVPVSTEAVKVGAHTSGSLLRVENGSGPQPATPFTPANFDELVDLINGNSNQYAKVTAGKISSSLIPIAQGTGISVTENAGVLTIAGSATMGTVTGVSADPPLSVSTSSPNPKLSLSQAGASSAGYLSAAHWTAFNDKQDAGNYITALTGPITASGPGSAVTSITAGAVGTTSLADGSVTTVKIADDAVTTSKIPNGNVTTAKIADGNVTSAKIADSNVTLAKIEDVAASRLVGRGNASAGAPQEISLGGGLSMSGAVLSAETVPVGSILTMMTASCPTGYLNANGAAVGRGTYPNLFAALGSMYGAGDGSTTFNLPDLRGYFLRGWDQGAGNDPDVGSRTARGDAAAGNNVGTKQTGGNASHAHGGSTLGGTANSAGTHSHTTTSTALTAFTATTEDIANGSDAQRTYLNNATGGTMTTTSTGAHTHTLTITGSTDSSGGNETRPKNIYVLYCIKH